MKADVEVLRLKALTCADQKMAATGVDFGPTSALVRLLISGAYLDGMTDGMLSVAPAVPRS